MTIDFDKALKTQLIQSLELEKYQWIIKNVRPMDVSKEKEFQRVYDGFYDVRRNEEWRKAYFCYFEEIKYKPDISFEMILKDLNNRLPKTSVEPSFSSKILATLNTQMPIWDSRVLRALGIDKEWNKIRTLDNAVAIYGKICDWYRDYMKSDESREIINKFDYYFSDYQSISSVKKIDYLLWCIG